MSSANASLADARSPLTGHPEIDAEHRLLLGMLTRLQELCGTAGSGDACARCGQEREEGCEVFLVETLGELLSFLVDHFHNEEQLMKACCPQGNDKILCNLHREDHAAISQQVQQIVVALDARKTAAHIEALRFLLGNWLANHVASHDMALVALLRPGMA